MEKVWHFTEAGMSLELQFHKRDVLLWRSWGLFPKEAFEKGLMMTLPSGREVKFVPCKNTKTPALKPVSSPGCREWVNTPHATELVVEIRPLS